MGLRRTAHEGHDVAVDLAPGGDERGRRRRDGLVPETACVRGVEVGMWAGDECGGGVGGGERGVCAFFRQIVVGGVGGSHEHDDARLAYKVRKSLSRSVHAAPMSDSKEWRLQPETEYRFELDPATSLAIKVPVFSSPRPHLTIHSSCGAMQRSLAPSSQRANLISLAPSARPPCSPGTVAPSR